MSSWGLQRADERRPDQRLRTLGCPLHFRAQQLPHLAELGVLLVAPHGALAGPPAPDLDLLQASAPLRDIVGRPAVPQH
eukprot:11221193-Lingulodinium_polyedra.AAC.1